MPDVFLYPGDANPQDVILRSDAAGPAPLDVTVAQTQLLQQEAAAVTTSMPVTVAQSQPQQAQAALVTTSMAVAVAETQPKQEEAAQLNWPLDLTVAQVQPQQAEHAVLDVTLGIIPAGGGPHHIRREREQPRPKAKEKVVARKYEPVEYPPLPEPRPAPIECNVHQAQARQEQRSQVEASTYQGFTFEPAVQIDTLSAWIQSAQADPGMPTDRIYLVSPPRRRRRLVSREGMHPRISQAQRDEEEAIVTAIINLLR